MNISIVDTRFAFQRLLDAPDAEVRARIFRDELIAPFQGLVNTFGGDGLNSFRMWGMSPDQFAPENHNIMAAKLDALDQADAWNRAAQSLDKARAAFAPYTSRGLPEHITFGLMVGELPPIPGQHGYTGFGGIPGWVMTVYGEPDAYNLARVEPCTVHEFHHNMRFSVYPFSVTETTVADYLIAEGLADSFAAEQYGEALTGPWVSEYVDPDFERTKAIFREGLDRTGFDVIRGYIFGGPMAASFGLESVDVPLLAGYAVGYRVVQQYVQRTGNSIVETTFLPANEIIADSGFFD